MFVEGTYKIYVYYVYFNGQLVLRNVYEINSYFPHGTPDTSEKGIVCVWLSG